MTRPALPFFILPPAALLALGGCEPQDQAPAIEGARSEQPAAPDDCLLLVWSNQNAPEVEFDRSHDAAEGGAISCATGTSPSQFEAAIAALRDAARSGNKARMLEEIGLPLMYIDASGNRRELNGRRDVDAVFDEVFDPHTLNALGRLDLSAMTVGGERGGFFELGALWLVVDEDGGRPRLVTINRQALDEAAQAAKAQAVRNQGEPTPFDKQ